MINFISNVSAQLTGQSFIAIGIAMVAGIIIGAIYYRLLGEAWRRAASITPEAARAFRSVGAYLIAGLGYGLLALALYGVTWHASFGEMSLRASLIAALLAWLGFIASTMVVNHRFQGRPLSLSMIDSAHWLLVIGAQGLIIGFLAS